ncbi:TlpA disulfide reductase family protein [Hymenobacter sp. BT559]|uniref:TlpA disulfide reductase family protein n=1 Tax=Hymenobacter sp. BT559 TaxID=2795729 RepID=UPI0018EA7199|nr:TlpA disulfide reductase family protein [Hymenobacter sp. BT559]MBJ6142212.1 redoxin domain-containing protein [Hymenobacter sp. BT559]
MPSCQPTQAAHPIRVEGVVKNLTTGKVYLTDAYDSKRVVDSALVTNGHFAFELAADSAFVPFLASIHYPDSTQKDWHYIRHLPYLNASQSQGKTVSATSAFFLGPEGAHITGDLTPASTGFLTIKAGPDNELYQQWMNKGFGYITTRDPAQRPARLHYFKSLVQQHPTSYFLLKGIAQDKENYSKQELADLFALFAPQVQTSGIGRDLRTYFVTRKEASAPYHNLVLADTSQVAHGILNPKAKLNLLVFWASWCGPCRQEIPALKQLYRAFHGNGLQMTSISIDKDVTSWRKALREEQMGWPQVVMAQDQRLQVEQQFSLQAIPVLILTDNVGNEVLKKTGYSEDEMAALQQAIAAGLQ